MFRISQAYILPISDIVLDTRKAFRICCDTLPNEMLLVTFVYIFELFNNFTKI